MRLKKLIYTAAAATVLVAGLGSCKKSAFNINRNPNQATDSTVSYDVILPAALHTSGVLVRNPWGFLQNWMGFWARSGTYAPNVIEETYQIPTTFGNAVWNTAYDNNYDYQIMQIKARQAGATMYEAIARIMKAHNFGMLVDVYGNVPYSEALLGNANPTPKYDDGAEIYRDLMDELDTAIVLINDAVQGANVNILDYDIMFGTPNNSTATFATQKTMWAKFANTVKLRLLVHLMNGGVNTPEGTIPGFDIPGEIAEIDANGYGFLGVGQNATVNPGYKSDKPNPFYTTYKTTATGAQAANNVYYRANEWGIGYYDYNGDPRISRSYEAGSNGYVGVAYGLPPVNENVAANLAGIGPGVYRSATASNPVLTSSESFFLQAEAAHRGFLSGSAATLTNNGILESFSFLGAANGAAWLTASAGWADIDYTAPSLDPSNPNIPEGGLFTIISQKWFALNGINPLEVWNDYRRVDMKNAAGVDVGHFIYGAGAGYDPGPPISVSPQNTSTVIPVRLLYPQTEYNYNAANVGAQGTINQFTSRVFWDIK